MIGKFIHKRGAIGRTDANGIDHNAVFGQFLRLRNSALIVIFPVADQHNRLVFFFFGIESGVTHLQRLGNHGTLGRHGIRTSGCQVHAGGAMIAGKRHLQVGPSREHHDTNPVVTQFIDELRDGLLGPFEPVGFNVVRQHALAHVECDHDIDPAAAYLFHASGFAQVGQRQYPEAECQQNQCEFNSEATGRIRADDFLNEPCIADAKDGFLFPADDPEVQRRQKREHQKGQQQIGILKTQHGGQINQEAVKRSVKSAKGMRYFLPSKNPYCLSIPRVMFIRTVRISMSCAGAFTKVTKKYT